jgi:hypothetical protein
MNMVHLSGLGYGPVAGAYSACCTLLTIHASLTPIHIVMLTVLN